jgi:adenosine kinase
MSVLICGSLAFDTITNFPGRFAQQILPDQVHNLSVSFLVPTLRREFGGCAGNIAYTLHRLGGAPQVKAARGHARAHEKGRRRGGGGGTALVHVAADSYTAQAIIITDEDNNQITAFHPGAMQLAHATSITGDKGIELAIIAPDGREAMLQNARQLHALNIPFMFDPGQQLPMFDGDALRVFAQQASWIAVNDYEAAMLCERMGTTLQALSSSQLRGIVVTLGAQGCDVWQQGRKTHVPGLQASAIVDPTGCGDAVRGALLYGLQRQWPLERCALLGNRLGALKIAHRGGQNHPIGPELLADL